MARRTQRRWQDWLVTQVIRLAAVVVISLIVLIFLFAGREALPVLTSAEVQKEVTLETLFLQNVRALNDYRDLGYELSYWRTSTGDEVDFVLHGERGLRAFELKRSATVRAADVRGLSRFREDYPEASACLLHLGTRRWHEGGIDFVPLDACLRSLDEWL